jgi:formate hydrogenlyase subunit 6/NADH:ubiquinone oxidoreductase subunit I
MEKVLIVDLDSCNGCRICELICSMHSGDKHNSKKSCIKVLSHKETEVHIPALDMSCDFCGRCVDWCPPRALSIVGLEEAILAGKSTKVGKIPAARISTVDD